MYAFWLKGDVVLVPVDRGIAFAEDIPRGFMFKVGGGV